MINQRIARCDSPGKVFEELQDAWSQDITLNSVNMATALHRIAKTGTNGDYLKLRVSEEYQNLLNIVTASLKVGFATLPSAPVHQRHAVFYSLPVSLSACLLLHSLHPVDSTANKLSSPPHHTRPRWSFSLARSPTPHGESPRPRSVTKAPWLCPTGKDSRV